MFAEGKPIQPHLLRSFLAVAYLPQGIRHPPQADSPIPCSCLNLSKCRSELIRKKKKYLLKLRPLDYIAYERYHLVNCSRQKVIAGEISGPIPRFFIIVSVRLPEKFYDTSYNNLFKPHAPGFCCSL